MKNTYIAIVVLVLVALGAFFFINKDTQAPAPTEIQEETSSTEEGGVNVGASVTVGAVKEFIVSGQNFSFSPSTIKVKKGDKVKITFKNSQGFHDFVIDEFGAATRQATSPSTEVLEFVANKSGSFEYYCSVGTHRSLGMKGTLIVE